MNKVNKKVNELAIRGMIRKNMLVEKGKEFLRTKHAGVDGIVVALILIVVAVGVGILFHKTILNTMSTTLTKAKTEIDKLFSGTVA